MSGAMSLARSSEPAGLVRRCPSNPVRGMPTPPSLTATVGQAAGAGSLQRLQYGLDLVAQVQVGVADECAGSAAGPIEAAGAGGRNALHELHLAHRPHLLRTARAVHGPGLDEDGRADVVAAVD